MTVGGVFARTPSSRGDVLRALIEDPASTPDLVDRVDASRSTVDRALEDLQGCGLVRRSEDTYEATAVGVQTYEAYRSYLRRLEALDRVGEVFEPLPPDAPLNAEALVGADVLWPETHAPGSVLHHTTGIVERATRICGVGPAIFTEYIQAHRAAVEANDCSLEYVLPPGVIETARSTFTEAWADLRETGALDLRVIDEALPYELWHAETPSGAHAGITVFDDRGVHGAVVNDTDAMVSWARSEFRAYRERARAIADTDL